MGNTHADLRVISLTKLSPHKRLQGTGRRAADPLIWKKPLKDYSLVPTVFHSELVWRLPSPEKKRFLDPGRAGVKDYNCLLYFFPSHGLTSIQCWEDFRLAEAVMRVVTILRLKTIVTQWLLWKEIKLPVKVCCSQHAVYFWKENIGTLCYWNQAKAIQNSLSSFSFIVRHFKRTREMFQMF